VLGPGTEFQVSGAVEKEREREREREENRGWWWWGFSSSSRWPSPGMQHIVRTRGETMVPFLPDWVLLEK
jgi:hypothetical protein